VPGLCVQQDIEFTARLTDFMTMQHDGIVPKEVELKPLHHGDDAFHVDLLPEDAEGQHENGILRVDRYQAVVAALVGIRAIADFW
jgi:hypothetical protein